MDKIREVALMCVGRAVMFGSLAIGCVMVGFSFSPVSSFRSGAVMTLMMAAVLMWKAMAADRQDPKTSEVWLYLDPAARPAEHQARFVFATIMREVYARYAQRALFAACLMFAISVGFVAFGFKPFEPPAALDPVPVLSWNGSPLVEAG